MPLVTKYRYDADTGFIEDHDFIRETRAYLYRPDTTRVSKTRGYGPDYYDSYEECRKATAARLENNVNAAKELLAAKREDLRIFRERNPK